MFKKILIAMGVFFIVVVAGMCVFIGIARWKCSRLDVSSKAYASEALTEIISGWQPEELMRRASPELSAVTSQQQIDLLFARLRKLGFVKQYDVPTGGTAMWLGTDKGGRITADYMSNATFVNGTAVISLKLIRHDGKWEILRFQIDSPLLAP